VLLEGHASLHTLGDFELVEQPPDTSSARPSLRNPPQKEEEERLHDDSIQQLDANNEQLEQQDPLALMSLQELRLLHQEVLYLLQEKLDNFAFKEPAGRFSPIHEATNNAKWPADNFDEGKIQHEV